MQNKKEKKGINLILCLLLIVFPLWMARNLLLTPEINDKRYGKSETRYDEPMWYSLHCFVILFLLFLLNKLVMGGSIEI